MGAENNMYPDIPYGPITIMNWSFVRKDIPREQIAYQLAYALRQEVVALEAAGKLPTQHGGSCTACAGKIKGCGRLIRDKGDPIHFLFQLPHSGRTIQMPRLVSQAGAFLKLCNSAWKYRRKLSHYLNNTSSFKDAMWVSTVRTSASSTPKDKSVSFRCFAMA